MSRDGLKPEFIEKMKKIFEPKKIEKKWYLYWEENKLFSPKVSSNKKPF